MDPVTSIYEALVSVMDPVTSMVIGKVAAGVNIGAAGAVDMVTSALYFLGFESAGVGSGSIVVVIQSWIGSVSAGSLFALLQSAGATGLAVGVKAGVATFGEALSGLLAYLW